MEGVGGLAEGDLKGVKAKAAKDTKQHAVDFQSIKILRLQKSGWQSVESFLRQVCQYTKN